MTEKTNTAANREALSNIMADYTADNYGITTVTVYSKVKDGDKEHTFIVGTWDAESIIELCNYMQAYYNGEVTWQDVKLYNNSPADACIEVAHAGSSRKQQNKTYVKTSYWSGCHNLYDVIKRCYIIDDIENFKKYASLKSEKSHAIIANGCYITTITASKAVKQLDKYISKVNITKLCNDYKVSNIKNLKSVLEELIYNYRLNDLEKLQNYMLV